MSQKETIAWPFTERDISVISMVKNKDMQLVLIVSLSTCW